MVRVAQRLRDAPRSDGVRRCAQPDVEQHQVIARIAAARFTETRIETRRHDVERLRLDAGPGSRMHDLAARAIAHGGRAATREDHLAFHEALARFAFAAFAGAGAVKLVALCSCRSMASSFAFANAANSPRAMASRESAMSEW